MNINNRGISAVGSARHWQCRGQGFESPMLHQSKVPPPRGAAPCFAGNRTRRTSGTEKQSGGLFRPRATKARSSRRESSPLCSTKTGLSRTPAGNDLDFFFCLGGRVLFLLRSFRSNTKRKRHPPVFGQQERVRGIDRIVFPCLKKKKSPDRHRVWCQSGYCTVGREWLSPFIW